MYRAFLSYSRSDERFAARLHQRLDAYRTPKSLTASSDPAEIPTRLHPIFRDRTDMAVGGELDSRITMALEQSERLIVICSPAAAASKWVDVEVATFLKQKSAALILPVLAPELSAEADVETAFFPPSLRGLGLLATDMRNAHLPGGRRIGDGWSLGSMKLIAALLGVPPDRLLQRERRRQRLAIASLAAASVLFAALAVASGWLGWLAQQSAWEAQQNATRADTALKRVLLSKAWQAVDNGAIDTATRYAIAGATALPAQSDEAAEVLQAAIFASLGGRLLSQPGGYLPLYSPDGRYLVVGSGTGNGSAYRGDLALWNPATGALERMLSKGSTGVQALSFSPDSRQLAAGFSDGEIALFDIPTGARRVIGKTAGPASVVELSNTGRFIVTAKPDRLVQLWRTDNGQLVQAWTVSQIPAQVSFSADDGLLAVSAHVNPGPTLGIGPRAWAFDTRSGAEVFDSFSLIRNTSWANEIVVSTDIQGRALQHTRGFEAYRWLDGSERTPRRSANLVAQARIEPRPGNDNLAYVAFRASVYAMRGPYSYNPGRYEPIAESNEGLVSDVSAGARLAAIGDITGRLSLFDLSDGYAYPGRKVWAHPSVIASVAVSPTSPSVASGSIQGTRLWLTTAWPAITKIEAEIDFITGGFLPDGSVITGRVEEGRAIGPLPLGAPKTFLEIITPGDQVGDEGRTRAIIQERLDAVPLESWEDVTLIRSSADGQVIAGLTTHQRMLVWNRNGAQIASIPGILNDRTPFTVSPDGNFVHVVEPKGLIRRVSLKGGPDVRFTAPGFREGDEITHLVASPANGDLLVVLNLRDGTNGQDSVLILDAASGVQKYVLKPTLGGGVVDADVSRDGHRILTTSLMDQSATVWDAQTSRVVTSLRASSGPLIAARISGDGRHVIAVGVDGLNLFSASTGRLLWNRPIDEFDEYKIISYSPVSNKVLVTLEDDLLLVDLSLLDLGYADLKDRACRDVLGLFDTFSASDLQIDPALQEIWHDPGRHVCSAPEARTR